MVFIKYLKDKLKVFSIPDCTTRNRTEKNVVYGDYNWPDTKPGTVAKLPCQYNVRISPLILNNIYYVYNVHNVHNVYNVHNVCLQCAYSTTSVGTDQLK